MRVCVDDKNKTIRVYRPSYRTNNAAGRSTLEDRRYNSYYICIYVLTTLAVMRGRLNNERVRPLLFTRCFPPRRSCRKFRGADDGTKSEMALSLSILSGGARAII